MASKSFVKKPPSPSVSALIAAVRNCDAKEVKRLLSQGVEVNQANERGYTALMTAAMWGQEEIARLLIDYKADVNKKGGCGVTPLMMAAMNNWDTLADLLIKAGANCAEKDDTGNTALDWAKDHEKALPILQEELRQRQQRLAAEKKARTLLAAIRLTRNLPYKKSPFRKVGR